MLKTAPNFQQATLRQFRSFEASDAFYEALIETHQGLSDDQSAALNARLILLLANHIGDLSVLQQALEAARASTPTNPA